MSIESTVAQNKLKTWLIMGLFVVFVTTIVYVFVKTLGYDISYVWFALVISAFMSIGSYYFSDKLVLATSGAKPADRSKNPELFEVVENISEEAKLPMPKVYVINDRSMNAFATGRNPKNAIVALTSGLLQRLNKVELEGVISHELSHVKNFDIRLMAIVAILVGFVAFLSNIFMRSIWYGGKGRDDRGNAQAILLVIGIVLALLSPVVATLIQLAISRKREFLADASGSLITKYPQGLASALEKIGKDHIPLRTANEATAHLFISNPFKGKDASFFASLFMTHPPVEERIKILRSM